MYSNPLPGVPIIESPFFDEVFGNQSLDTETRRIAHDLHKDGFAIIDFPEPDFSLIADRIRSDLDGKYDWEGWRRGDRSDLRIQDAWRDNADVEILATNPSIAVLLDTLYGRASFPFQTLNFAVGTEQHFHTDSLHFSSVPERFMCGIWVALEDIGPDQGPLIYYPGSHRWPIFTNEHVGHTYMSNAQIGNYGPIWERLVEVNGVSPRQFHPRKGQAAIWAANLLHGGAAQNDKTLTRWSQVTHYYFENCSYYTPFLSDPFYGSIAYREPINILSKDKVSNFYNGLPVPEIQIQRASPQALTNFLDPLPEGFDEEAYLELNQDVREAGVDAISHYRSFGRSEGRAYRKVSLD